MIDSVLICSFSFCLFACYCVCEIGASNHVCIPFDIKRHVVIQSAQDNLCRAAVAQYDESVQPKSATIDGKQAFQFNYQNGEGMIHL